ncbi:MAG: MBL fold metallo-hydrolase [Candidatus Sumerlaeaceae bacterium]|nr:MBL fold metallo-hydrolase [Candidatus Sumerlaeaceae bacterium]
MKIGSYRVDLIPVTRFMADGGAAFGVIPRKIWSRAYPHANDDNQIPMMAYALLIRGKDAVVVVDSGCGNKMDAKWRKAVHPEDVNGGLIAQLSARGVQPEDVTHFVYTHLHFDHAGGATVLNSEGKAAPLFPRAKHFIQKSHLEWARKPSEKDRASFTPDNWEPVVAAGLMEILDGNQDLLPGIELRVVNGHTTGLQMVIVHGNYSAGSDASGVAFIADLVPTAAHLPVYYVPAYDNYPLLSIEERRLFLGEAVAKNWVVVLGHDPFTPAMTLKPGPKGFEMDRQFF